MSVRKMGWFGGSPSKISAVSEVQHESQAPLQLLEDLPPKFEDKEPAHESQTTFVNALQKFLLNDLTIDHYVGMPCFREAMLTGFQSMGVLGTVTFLIHKSPSRSVHWGVCGFFLGSVVGWEQCRSIRRRSFQTVEAAKQANQDKLRKRLEQRQDGDHSLESFNQVLSKEKEN
ncbi:CIC11C00000002873 [Sungouiella intermedia]|uniref:Cytochrome c oxidase assembly protein COX20, mitochondrial n=1 Tax=Sungouiella intermedia TaxID=45354 RepID=A0A1L0BVU3_9ASCO|nr:CIC11C00000002873 [[Candida] intermedia]